MNNICKHFPGVQALKDVNIDLYKGEVHVLVGENGAGKSTLMKILCGEYNPDEGEIYLKGEKIAFRTPRDALKHGLAMIHQELTPIAAMTVTENIFLGREIVDFDGGPINRKKMRQVTQDFLDRLGIHISPDEKMMDLNVSEVQMIEIVKSIFYNAEILVMDEPTSSITDREIDRLFEIINKLKKEGTGIIYISHKMDEIFKIADRITVLRDGEHIATKQADEVNINSLITMMVGREITEMYPQRCTTIGDVVLSVQNISYAGAYENISFDLRRGEVLGIAGLVGSGRSELLETIFGARTPDSGEIFIEGQRVHINHPKEAIRMGLSFVPEDRKADGLNYSDTIKNNMSLVKLNEFSKFGYIDRKKEMQAVEKGMRMLNIKANSPNDMVNTLSGGNQQKVIIAKWLMNEAKIILLDEPTRGIDVGAKVEIYSIINKYAQEGNSVIMVSSELPEIVGMSDRVIVMHAGKKTGEISKDEVTQQRIMQYATDQVEACINEK